MITWGHLRCFVVGAGLVAALAACQGSGEAAATPRPVRPTEVSASAPTASPASSATAKPSVEVDAWARVPKAARAHTFAGAQAFAEFYVEQINKAWTAPDPELLRPYGLPSCKSCANYVTTAESMRAQAQHFQSDVASVSAGAWFPESTDSLALVSLVWRQKPVALVDATGAVVHRSPGLVASSEFQLRWQGDAWHVAGIHLESSSK